MYIIFVFYNFRKVKKKDWSPIFLLLVSCALFHFLHVVYVCSMFMCRSVNVDTLAEISTHIN